MVSIPSEIRTSCVYSKGLEIDVYIPRNLPSGQGTLLRVPKFSTICTSTSRDVLLNLANVNPGINERPYKNEGSCQESSALVV